MTNDFKTANGMEIKKRFEKAQALEILDDIKEKICGRDIEEICENITLADDVEFQKANKRLIQGIQCGLIEWNDEENCLVQQLIKSLKSGSIETTELKYKNRPTIAELQNIKASNEVAAFIEIMSDITARPTQIIGMLSGLDLQIAMGCMSFFVN